MARSRSGETGVSRAGCLATLALFLLGLYVGAGFVESEMDYRKLQSTVLQHARFAAEEPDQTIRTGLQTRAAELGLPSVAGQPTIRRFPESRIQIIIRYPEVHDFFGRWQWVRNRRIAIDQKY